MGQKIGRARIHDDAAPFCNLPRDDIYELWDRFNDIADGFGLNLEARIGTGRPMSLSLAAGQVCVSG